jgi:hypothetical protein
MTQFGSVWNKKLPAQKTGGLYTTQWQIGFVAACPSHAFRDGPGIFMVELCHY